MSATDILERAMFRKLLRLGRSADRQPGRVAGLLGRPPRLYNPDEQKPVIVPSGDWPFVDDALRQASGGSTEYAHPAFHKNNVVTRALRRHRTLIEIMGLPYLPQAAQLQERLETARAVALRLGAVKPEWTDPWMGDVISQETAKPKEVETPNTGMSLHGPLARVRPDAPQTLRVGDVLITHPISGLFQPLFDQAILLVLRVNAESDTAQGVILNKETDMTLSQVLVEKPTQLLARPGVDNASNNWNKLAFGPLEPLLEEHIFQGGPVVHQSLDDNLLCLHSHGEIVPGATEIAASVSLGGDLGTAAAHAHASRLHGKPLGLRFFQGFAAWSISQLEIELERGIWIHAKPCPETLRQLCFAQLESPRESWQAALHASGLSVLAEFPRGGSADTVLQAYVEAHQRARALELANATHNRR